MLPGYPYYCGVIPETPVFFEEQSPMFDVCDFGDKSFLHVREKYRRKRGNAPNHSLVGVAQQRLFGMI